MNFVIQTSFEVGGVNPHELKMDQEPKLPCFSNGPQKHLLPLCTQWPRLNTFSPGHNRTPSFSSHVKSPPASVALTGVDARVITALR